MNIVLYILEFLFIFLCGAVFGIIYAQVKDGIKEPVLSQPKEPEWRTSWAVLDRLRNAATNPPSLNDSKNVHREPDDLWRTVLLSDLQELLNHAGIKKKKPPTLKQRQEYFDMVKRIESRIDKERFHKPL